MQPCRWDRYRRALAGEPLPAALVDLDAFDRNVDRLLAPIRAAGKRARLATKSIRCPALFARAAERGGDVVIGAMTYTAAETAMYAELAAAHGGHAARAMRDLVLAYPTMQASDAALIARANRDATAAIVVDDPAQLAPLVAAAREAGGATRRPPDRPGPTSGSPTGVRIPVAIELDASWRPLDGALHLGVRRSPLRSVDGAVAVARRIAAERELRFAGLMSYEAQLAGLQDRSRARGWQAPIIRAIKRGSEPAVAEQRRRVVAALTAAGLAPALVNGGGTGSVDWSSADATLTEVTIGSGFLCGHLFDGYRGLPLAPAIAFALQVVRRPDPGLATCLGGGWIASGQAGADRLPLPAWPLGCRLLPAEGAGEVQTPVALPAGRDVALGDPIFFRPAKSGELAEHVAEYLLVRGDRIVDRVPTYRGLGKCFL